MIDQDFQKECHIFLCYRAEGAEIAKNFKKGLANHKSRYFGYVWYSDQENIGNFVFDIPNLIPTAQYAIIFFSKNFTKDFLVDGKNNYGNERTGEVGCVTVREIVEIERCRQAGKLTVIGVHLDGYTLQPSDKSILEQVFRNEGILTDSSVAAYTELNINAYYPRTTDVETFTDTLSRGLEKQRVHNNKLPTKISLDRLLPPLCYHYYGRDDLFVSANCVLESKACLNIAGPVGSGKSAFVFHWLLRLAEQQYHGAEYVLYWSFEQSDRNFAISPDLSSFFEFALSFFEIYDIADRSSELEKATAIATFMQNHSVLLILDGIDTFQSRSHGQEGLLLNQAMKKVVTSVSRTGVANNGLLVLLSTFPVADLQYYASQTETITLTSLSPDNCVSILRDFGVAGSKSELLSAVKELNYDPMAITLMGKLLVTHYNGSIKERYRVRYADEAMEHTTRILAFYEDLWSPDTKEGVVLLLCCLFRYSIQPENLVTLLEKTRVIPELSVAQRADIPSVLNAFKKAGLLHGEYELHLLPIVRERFRQRFREQMPSVFHKCNRMLADIYCQLCNDAHVSTIADISPLYDAVFYYIQANEPENAISVLWNRIFRKRTFFSQKQLGATTNDLFVISLFFDVENDWRPHPRMSLVDAAWLSSVAAYLQNNMGNLAEAEKLRRRELEIYESLSHHLFLASDGQNLARNLMLQGKIEESEQAFLRSLQALEEAKGQTYEKNPYAKDIDAEQLKTNISTRYAYLLYLRGQEHWDQANALLQPLNARHLRETTTGMFYYCYVRLHTAEPKEKARVCEEIEKEYLTSFDHRKKHEIAYANLLRAQTALARTNIFRRRKAIKMCLLYAGQAIEDAKIAGRMDQLPLLLNEILGIYLHLLQKEHTKKRRAQLLLQAETVIGELDETFSLHELPIYRVQYLFLKAKYFTQIDNRQQALRLLEELSHSPICIRYFSRDIQELRQLVKE